MFCSHCENKKWTLFFVGILFTFLGVLGIVLPVLSTIASEMLIAGMLTAAGIVTLVRFWKEENPWLLGSSVALAFLYILIGLLIFFFPIKAAITITALLGIFFFLQGIFEIVWGFKSELKNRWWIIFGGILSLVLSALVFMNFPESSLWLLGLLVSINLLFYGFGFLFVSFDKK